MNSGVIIETISTGHPDFLGREFVTLANQSDQDVDLSGWRVVWTEIPTGRELHRHVFNWDRKRPFKRGRKLFLFSGIGTSGFCCAKENPRCPIAHWEISTGSRKHICSTPYVKIVLYDAHGTEVDNRYSMQGRYDRDTRPTIAIGHGRNLAWRDVKDYLHDQCGFEVEAFETDNQTSRITSEIIASLGDNSNMAILVLTGEDKTSDGNIRARQNVIHELGKFQERFGNNKTIVLVEKGVELPSNISGIIYVGFEPGQIKSTLGDIIVTINREFSLWR